MPINWTGAPPDREVTFVPSQRGLGRESSYEESQVATAVWSWWDVTESYVAGELSALIGDLSLDSCAELVAALRDLRHRVECTPLCCLAPLAAEALQMADAACWALLDRGDADAFLHEAADAAALCEFATSAALLP